MDDGTTGPPPYPVGLQLQGRRVVVAGGGPAAQARVAGLRAAGADVLVVAPQLSPSLASLAGQRLIAVRRRGFLPADLDGAWLVLTCTGRPEDDAAVAAAAGQRRIWCLPGHGAGSRVLVLGGARSGKSAAAEGMLAGHPAVEYVATGPLAGTGDPEWDHRVAAHRARRPPGWRTAETLGLEQVLGSPGTGEPVLVDCLSTWLTRVMDGCGCWDAAPGAARALADRTGQLVAAWRSTRRQVVAVSNEVGSGVVPATLSGRLFRDELGHLNARLAAASDEVWLCTAGIARRLR
jgi:adenosylcobinamide kinase/adenosylcobinamide-phosphate guanylyltransferase